MEEASSAVEEVVEQAASEPGTQQQLTATVDAGGLQEAPASDGQPETGQQECADASPQQPLLAQASSIKPSKGPIRTSTQARQEAQGDEAADQTAAQSAPTTGADAGVEPAAAATAGAAAAADVDAAVGEPTVAPPAPKPAPKKVVKKTAPAKPPVAAAAAAEAAADLTLTAETAAAAGTTTGTADAAAAPPPPPPKAAVKPPAAKPPVLKAAAPQRAAAAAGEEPAAAGAAAPPIAAKPAAVKTKAPLGAAIPAAGGPPPAAAAAAAGPPVVGGLGSNSYGSSHGSSTSRRLQALLAEGSAVSVLSTEGSELPGSRPPAQLHGTLDGNGGEVDSAEEQEIQKIISEIHGTGDDSEDEEPQQLSQPSKLASTTVAAGASGAAAAVPTSLVEAGLPAADTVQHEEMQPDGHGASHSSSSSHHHQNDGVTEAAAVAAEAAGTVRVVAAAAAAAADNYNPEQAEEQGSRASPWPDVTQIRRELLEQDSSTSSSIQHGSPTTSTTAAAAAATAAAAAAAPATNGSLTARSAPVVPVAAAGLRASGNGAAAAAVANADFGDMAGSGGSSMQASPAEYEGDSLNSVYDGLGGLEGELLGEENERSRAIAEQLAQLHEESRRLQVQSQVLQQRAIEMSLQMVAGGGSSSSSSAEPLTVNPSQHHPDLNLLGGSSHHPHPHVAAGGVVPLSQVGDLQSAMLVGVQVSEVVDGLVNPVGHQGLLPAASLGASDVLGLGSGVLPRHPPGDSTPSSVTSSRAGLNWSLPSRGGIPSPNKMESYSPVPASPSSYLNGADAAGRYGSPGGSSRPNPHQHGYALHADPSLDYNMYSYGNNGSHNVNNTGSRDPSPGSGPSFPYIHQQQQVLPPADSPIPKTLAVCQGEIGGGSGATNPSNNKAQSFRKQRSQKGSTSGQSPGAGAGQNPVIVRKSPLPFKVGPGVTTRVAAAGATAGRRSSTDACAVGVAAEDGPTIGTFAVAHALAGAAGSAVKTGGGRLSPRAAAAAAAAVAATASAQPGKQAGSSNSHSTKGRAGIAGAAGAGAHSNGKGSGSGPTAAALAAAAAAAGSSGRFHGRNAAAAAPAVPWGPMGPFPGGMYGTFGPANAAAMAAANPAMITMMMMKQQQQQPHSPNSKGIASKISPNKALGVLNPAAAPWMPGMLMRLPPGFMPMQGPVSAPGGPGGKGVASRGAHGGAGGPAAAGGMQYGGMTTAASNSKARRAAASAGAVPPPSMMMPFGVPVMPGMAPYMNMAPQMAPMSFNPYALNPAAAAAGAKMHAGMPGGGSTNTHGNNSRVQGFAAPLGFNPGMMPAGPLGFMPAGGQGFGMMAPQMYGGGANMMQQQQQQGGKSNGRGAGFSGVRNQGKSGWTN